MRLPALRVGMVAGACVALIGCGDPLEGDWQSDEKACGSHRHEFTIDSGGDAVSGEGDFWFASNSGSCVKCSGSISGKEKSTAGSYDIEVNFSGDQGCSELPDGNFDCKLKSDDTVLSCEGEAPFGDVDFELVE